MMVNNFFFCFEQQILFLWSGINIVFLKSEKIKHKLLI